MSNELIMLISGVFGYAVLPRIFYYVQYVIRYRKGYYSTPDHFLDKLIGKKERSEQVCIDDDIHGEIIGGRSVHITICGDDLNDNNDTTNK